MVVGSGALLASVFNALSPVKLTGVISEPIDNFFCDGLLIISNAVDDFIPNAPQMIDLREIGVTDLIRLEKELQNIDRITANGMLILDGDREPLEGSLKIDPCGHKVAKQLIFLGSIFNQRCAE